MKKNIGYMDTTDFIYCLGEKVNNLTVYSSKKTAIKNNCAGIVKVEIKKIKTVLKGKR